MYVFSRKHVRVFPERRTCFLRMYVLTATGYSYLFDIRTKEGRVKKPAPVPEGDDPDIPDGKLVCIKKPETA